MSLTFHKESLKDCLEEIKPLWFSHWKETEGYRDIQGYSPDISQFLYMEELGWFAEYTARNEDGKMVGHAGFIIHKSRHTSKKTAIEDYFYLLPEARQGMAAVKLLRFAIADLKKTGCVDIGMSSKLTNDIEPLLKRVGFTPVAKLYMMNVQENL